MLYKIIALPFCIFSAYYINFMQCFPSRNEHGKAGRYHGPYQHDVPECQQGQGHHLPHIRVTRCQGRYGLYSCQLTWLSLDIVDNLLPRMLLCPSCDKSHIFY